MEWNEALYKYSEITLEAIDYLQGGNNVLIKKYMDRRSEVLNELKDKNFPKDEFKCLYEELKLSQLDEKLKSVINERMLETRKKIKQINQLKKVKKNYDTGSRNPLMLSIKI